MRKVESSVQMPKAFKDEANIDCRFAGRLPLLVYAFDLSRLEILLTTWLLFLPTVL
jgi:hypothetical protein